MGWVQSVFDHSRPRAAWLLLACFSSIGVSPALAEVAPSETTNAASVSSAAKPAGTPRERIPTAAFAAREFMSEPDLSPLGDRVATRVQDGESAVLGVVFLFNEPGGPPPGLRKIDVGDAALRWYRWANNDLLLVSLLQENSQAVFSSLYVYNVVTEDLRPLGSRNRGLIGDDVLYVADDGSYLLLAMAPSVLQHPAVYRVDIANGEMEKIQSAMRPILDWYADQSGVVRLGFGYSGRKTQVVYRDSGDEEFRTIARLSWEDSDAEIDTIRFRGAGQQGFTVTNAKTGRFGLYDFDWNSFEVGEPIFEHPLVDIDNFWTDRNGDVSAVLYTDDRQRVHWIDPAMNELQAEIDGALAGRSNWVVSKNRDLNRFIVWTTRADDPGHFYFYDRNAGVMSRLATPIEDMKGKPLSPVKAIQFTSRDGLQIQGYLTLPRGSSGTNLPLVVVPHGGPHVRDTWTYDADVQFLANRGYAVLQPNFRGSTGYGKKFLEKGYGQWGGAMQTDLDDGVAWLVSEGVVDAKRVCIMGASYGGYAALIAAITSPEVYRCAVSYAGVTDVNAWMKSHRNDMLPTRYRKWRQKVHGEEAAEVEVPSPIDLAGQVSIPVLLGHGTADDRVPFRQGEKMARALRRADKDVEFLKLKDAGHGYEGADHVRFLNAVEAFLKKHNPADL